MNKLSKGLFLSVVSIGIVAVMVGVWRYQHTLVEQKVKEAYSYVTLSNISVSQDLEGNYDEGLLKFNNNESLKTLSLKVNARKRAYIVNPSNETVPIHLDKKMQESKNKVDLISLKINNTISLTHKLKEIFPEVDLSVNGLKQELYSKAIRDNVNDETINKVEKEIDFNLERKLKNEYEKYIKNAREQVLNIKKAKEFVEKIGDDLSTYAESSYESALEMIEIIKNETYKLEIKSTLDEIRAKADEKKIKEEKMQSERNQSLSMIVENEDAETATINGQLERDFSQEAENQIQESKPESSPRTDGFNFNGYHYDLGTFYGEGSIPIDNKVYRWGDYPSHYLIDIVSAAGGPILSVGIGSTVTVEGATYRVTNIRHGVDINEGTDALVSYPADITWQTCETVYDDSTVTIWYASRT